MSTIAAGNTSTTGLVQSSDTTGSLVFQSNNSTTVTINSTSLTLASGVKLDLGSTGQIQFPATQNASTNANTLDDYEEGTFTGGSYSDIIGNAGATGTWTAGWYVKVGKKVTIGGYYTTNSCTASARMMTRWATGLPYSADTATYSGGFWGNSNCGNNISQGGAMNVHSSTGLQLNVYNNAFDSGTQAWYFGCTYLATA